MKLNNTIILTLQDFRRQFDFSQFWARRKQFVRDMHPDKVFYGIDSDIELYDAVCKWIYLEDCNGVTESQRNNGIAALRCLSCHEITDLDLRAGFNSLDYTSDIIYVTSGTDKITLPTSAELSNTKRKSEERLHKIEITGRHEGETAVFIGCDIVAKLKAGDCIYVTEINNMFIRALPNKGSKGCCHLSLENIPGHFTSNLHAIISGFGTESELIENVTQFRFFNGYFEHSNDNYLKYDTI